VRLNKRQIEQKAAYGGASGCRVDLLKTEAIANEVADRLWQNLRESNKTLERRFVNVLPSMEYPGTWLVRYRRIRMPSGAAGARETNARRGEAMKRAVMASYSSSDLVDSWTS